MIILMLCFSGGAIYPTVTQEGSSPKRICSRFRKSDKWEIIVANAGKLNTLLNNSNIDSRPINLDGVNLNWVNILLLNR